LLAKVKRGHFTGFWTLPGGYMDHDEHPSIGCVRETMEELGIDIQLNDIKPVITQKIFNDEGISFVSFTYQATWNGDINELALQTEEIEEAMWFSPDEALENAVSFFDSQALQATL
jgi:ADP-ribose pyrophosphatase YjhB (NUDIX family)